MSKCSPGSTFWFSDKKERWKQWNSFQSLNFKTKLHLFIFIVLFCLKVGERKFTAHRIVLAASIPYFHAMFTHDMVESKQNEITMQGIDPRLVIIIHLMCNFKKHFCIYKHFKYLFTWRGMLLKILKVLVNKFWNSSFSFFSLLFFIILTVWYHFGLYLDKMYMYVHLIYSWLSTWIHDAFLRLYPW